MTTILTNKLKIKYDLEKIQRDYDFIKIIREDKTIYGAHILDLDFVKVDAIVFENGQGLLLDQNNTEYFPHLTPSNTGCKNPLEIISKSFTDKKDLRIEACYVTRTYLTRHGAGRLDNECKREDINEDMLDHTNLPNPHQGTLRYGYLITGDLTMRISADFKLLSNQYPFDCVCSLAMTHVNEYIDDNVWNLNYGFEKNYISDGETRSNIRTQENLNFCF